LPRSAFNTIEESRISQCLPRLQRCADIVNRIGIMLRGALSSDLLASFASLVEWLCKASPTRRVKNPTYNLLILYGING